MRKRHFKPWELMRPLSPEQMGLRYTSAQRIEISDKRCFFTKEEEFCLIVLEGCVHYGCGLCHGKAQMLDVLYVPINSSITLESSGAVVMRYGAPCSIQYSFSHIRFSDVNSDHRHKVYGAEENGTRRDVWNFIDEDFPCGRFLVGICRGRDGGWTAWPPHEHAQKREEVYVYFNMGDGFGIQCVYEDMNQPDTIALVRNGDLVSIPKGYHPNCGSPHGGIFYAYCMVATTEGDRTFMDLHCQNIYGDRLE